MSNKHKKTALPKLRFPEFQKTGGWEKKPLHALANKVANKNKDETITRVLTNSAAHGVVDQLDFFDKDIANKNNLGGYFVVKEGDYVYNPRISNIAPVGPISKNKLGLGIMSPLYTVFGFSNAENDFYEHYFKSSHWHAYMHEISNSGARHDRISITSGEFMEMPLPYPKPEEQQKIADCLSSVDETIVAEGQKLEALQDYKKGLMQQLFPAEGETLPKLRFPEFQNAPKWRVESLGEIIKTVTPPQKLQTKDYMPHGEIPIIDQSPNQYVGWTNNKEAIIEAPLPLIIFGDHTCTLKLAENSFAQGADGIKIFCGDKKIRTNYLYYALHASPLIMKEYRRHFSLLKEKLISFPGLKSGEQQRIADCLSSLDDLITAQSQKIEALQEHKKGLMQQLFPSAEEVMG